MNILHSNLDVLQRRFPHVKNTIDQLMPETPRDLDFMQEPCEKDWNWLEAVKQSVSKMNCIFVYGFGQGLGVADLLEMYPDRLIIVYEPNEYLFRETLSDYDVSFLLNCPNLSWISVGESQLKTLFYMLSTYMEDKVAFVALRPFLESDMDVLRDIKKEFEEFNLTYQSNLATTNFFRRDWIRNSLFQMAGMLSSPPIEKLKNAFPGITAIVIGSGPSLQKDIEWLRKLKPHALIIAAGSSIQSLVKHGIKPHLVVTLDGGKVNDKVFLAPETLESPLLYASSSYYGITDRKQNETIHAVLSNDLISLYFMGIDRNSTALSPTPTVTGTAMQAAVWLGARRVIMMGQDLSFPGNKFYSDGIEHIEQNKNDEIVANAPKKVLNVHGTYNLTNDNFLFMKVALESLFESLPGIEFINSTRDGARLEGTTWMPIEEVYERYKYQGVEESLISNLLYQNEYVLEKDKIQQIQRKIEDTLVDISQTSELLIQMNKLLKNIREWSRTKPNKCQLFIVKIEQLWTQIVDKEWFVPIIETMLPRQIKRFDEQQPLIAIEKDLIKKSNMIYRELGDFTQGMKEIIPELEELLQESIRRMDDIVTNMEML